MDQVFSLNSMDFAKGVLKIEEMEPIQLPIEDVLDLHTFQPRELPHLLNDYFAECIKKKIWAVRIIHGKGHGIQKKRVRQLLRSNPCVQSFRDAPPEAGGWGATLVELKRN